MPATPEVVYAALTDPALLSRWLPPSGMTGRFERFDARPGGSYRLVLTYQVGSPSQGKATADTDIVEARFVDLEPGKRVVQAVEFVSGDPVFAGTMTMVWELTPTGEGTLTEFRAHDVPSGISAAEHVAGMSASLANLARLLQT